MATFFLMLIYITFISLGLPDSLLGAVWPVMRGDIGASLGAAGILSMIVSGGTILSSLASERVINRFGTGPVTAVSVLATAAALLGFSQSPSFVWLIGMAIPLGLGAGAVDAALNNYVAVHYEARHMSWLHCFWGVGAFCGPMILAACIQRGYGWRTGYLVIGCIQAGIAILLFATLWLWSRQNREKHGLEDEDVGDALNRDLPKMPPLQIPGVLFALLTFLFYCAAEHSTGLWSASYLVEQRGLSETWGARGAALFFGGITVGRFLNGFLAHKYPGPFLIRLGVLVIMTGAVLILLPLPAAVAFAGLGVIGLGCAPVYPCMIHETPRRFGIANSQKIVGLQMAVAYCGSTFLPPLLGFAAERLGLVIFPYVVFLFGLAMLALSESITRAVARGRKGV